MVGHAIAAILQREDETWKAIITDLGYVSSAVFVVTSIAALPPQGATLSLILFAWLMLGAMADQS